MTKAGSRRQIQLSLQVPKMPRDGLLTRTQIVAAADELFYSQGLHAVSVDAIAEKAGVTKKTFYYHFTSKDELIGSYLDARDRPTVDRFKLWAGSEGSVADRMTRFFAKLGKASQGPRWNGCGFLRAAAELANMPGHPALTAARNHKARCEQWLLDMVTEEGHADAKPIARALMVLIDGAVSQLLIHRDAKYAISAGLAARSLLSKNPL
ncbi:MAG TPA: helix-turn-helix domain-containing protein [Terriglobales bacterium]|nr:helix-turn-helix domain-containing protein [Terriglobales bacterium]